MANSTQPALPQRRILLTGANSGIGFQAALMLCRQGHPLLLPCRDAATAEGTLERLERELGSVPSAAAPVCDLADLASVEHCATALLRRGDPIDTLVLNAGLQYTGAGQPRFSAQGHELTVAVNHLGHQALTQQLLALLALSQAPRVVVTASEVHDPGMPGGRVGMPAGLGDLAGLKAGAGFTMVDGLSPFNADKAYKDSKLCNLLFARELERLLRLQGTPMTVLAWSPGLVIPRGSDGFFRYSRCHNEWGQRLFALVARDLLRITATPAQAGALLAGLATDPAHDSEGFRYFSNRLAGPGRLRFEAVEPSTEAQDDNLAQALWTASAELVGLTAAGQRTAPPPPDPAPPPSSAAPQG